MVREHLDALDANYLVFNQRQVADCDIRFEIDCGRVSGELRLGRSVHSLRTFGAIYARLMDDRSMPELESEPPDSPARQHNRGFHDALNHWMEVSPAVVVNRFVPMGSNSSKAYQTQIIQAQGFLIPPTLVTSEPDAVLAFQSRHGRVIYKSLSSVRSIVQQLDDAALARLDRIRWCPTQFQAFVAGTNVRVHVIGNRIYATAVSTEATDYRYAARQAGKSAELREVKLSDELARRCIDLARYLGLEFAGIDLKVTSDDEVYCFEVNPSPAFSYYENNTGQPIALGVALRLMDADGQVARVDCEDAAVG
jgi:hypothetical protein